jgi:DHA1 family tetracycline resistance protein-like MFS transporter
MTKRTLFVLAPLFSVIVLDVMGLGLIIPIISPMFMNSADSILSPHTSLAMRELLYGITLASFSLLMLFGAPFLGDLSDFLGRKKVLIICLLVTALGLLISALGISWHSVTILIIGRCIAGFAAGSQPIAQAAIADVSTQENKAMSMSYIIFAACVGFVLGPMVGGYFANSHFISWFNYSTPFYIAAILALINALSVAVAFQETFIPETKKELRVLKGLLIFWSAFTNRPLRPLILIFLFTELGFSVYFVYVSLYLVHEYQFTTINVGHFMTYLGIIWGITFTLIVRMVLKFLTLKKILLLSLFLLALGSFCAMWPLEWVLWVTAIPLCIGNGLCYTAILTLLSNATDAESQGWIMGVTGALNAIAWVLGAMMGGVLGSWYLNLPFVTAFILLALAWVLYKFYCYTVL